MMAESRPKPKSRKPTLISKLEGCGGVVNKAIIIPKEDGIISVSDDRTVRVWLKRDSGMYWPSICHSLPSACSTMEFNTETNRIFIGLDNGSISEFSFSEDYNRIIFRRDYLAHDSRVAGVIFSLMSELVLSVGRDKFLQWHDSETGRRLGGYKLNAWGTCLQFDDESKHTFVGDYSGTITIIRVSDNGHQLITCLNGHSGSIRSLAWDKSKKLLFSGSFDQSIIVWDIGGNKGTAFELQGHSSKVEALFYCNQSCQLFSSGEDSRLVVWNMAAKRQETPEWQESDVCQKCNEPFFWNIKEMWNAKTIGVRQHHCRRCGQALCDKCSCFRSTLPAMGFEFEVRVCETCSQEITDEERAPMATFHDVKQNVVSMHIDEVKGQLVTCGTDRVIKLWDVTSLLM